MKLIVFVLLFMSCSLFAQEKKSFHALDVIIQTESPIALGAWQAELAFNSSKLKITGIEGGEKPFREPADYDSRGFEKGKVILASFTLQKSAQSKEFYVGTIHFYGSEKDLKKCVIKLIVAADSKGNKIKASAILRSKKSNE